MRQDAFVGRRHEIERTLVCAMQGQFPVLIAPGGAELAAVFRVGAGHYGLSGTLATARSLDGGVTWAGPIEVWPRGEDVRNPAFGVHRDRWVLGYWEAGVYCYPSVDGKPRAWKSPRDGGPAPDLFVVTSRDHGTTWSARVGYRSDAYAWLSPYGRIVEQNGTLLMSAYGRRRDADKQIDAVIVRSRDGVTWGDETRVLGNATETSLCVVGDQLVAAARRSDQSTSITRSSDGGRTWSEPLAVTRALEHPADLCLLRDSKRLMMTFGRRIRPLGCAAITSPDAGATWNRDREVLLASDGVGQDVGYPSTQQIADGTLVTVLYFAHGSAGEEQAHWGETSCQALRYSEALVT
ncbi:MAG TPA: sialidase family protein [Kofleriaceae bacterium]|jgi:hypothetical protein